MTATTDAEEAVSRTGTEFEKPAAAAAKPTLKALTKEILVEKDLDRRDRLIWSLASFQGPKTLRVLSLVSARTSCDAAHHAVAELADAVGRGQVIAELSRLARRSNSEEVRVGAVQLLARTGELAGYVAQEMGEALEYGNERMRTLAAWCLTDIAGPEHLEQLTARLADSEECLHVRVNATCAMLKVVGEFVEDGDLLFPDFATAIDTLGDVTMALIDSNDAFDKQEDEEDALTADVLRASLSELVVLIGKWMRDNCGYSVEPDTDTDDNDDTEN